jgi:hypothetical protein
VLYSGGKLAHAHTTGGYGGGHHAGLWMALAGCAVIGAAPTLVGALT